MRLKFTKAAIDGLPVPEKGRERHYDTRQPGLTISINAGGRRTFYFYRKVKGKPEEIKLGTYPGYTIEQAQRKAAIYWARAEAGEPLHDDEREPKEEMTFEALFKWYIKHHAESRKRDKGKEDQGKYDKHLAYLGALPVSDVTRGRLRELHATIGAEHPTTANRVIALVRSIFSQAIKHDVLPGPNPASGISMFREKSRDRRLKPNEVASFLAAVYAEPNETIRDYVLLSLLTGARRSNVLAMRWDQLDLDDAEWRIPETKNGTPQTIPLEEAEISILRERESSAKGPWVFPGRPRAEGKPDHLKEPKKGWDRILKRAGIEDFRIHDLRRSLASFMVDQGASLAIIGRALNHKSQATTAVYARVSTDPIRQAKRAAHKAIAELQKAKK